jgi:myo-inositol-1(or 4)-monophosphatase
LAHDPLFLSTAIEAAISAGRVHKKYFRQDVAVHKKGPIDLVTAADLEVERQFRVLIADRFPDHVVLGEEQGTSAADQRTASHRWIIDPVDGTTNFAHGIAVFCVSIALEIDGRIDVGVVYDPIADELFSAERGQGARLNGLPMRVSGSEDLIDALLCTGFPYSVQIDRQDMVNVFSAFLGKAQGIRRLGSAALDLCYVAAGRLEGFWENGLQAWDMAAGVLLVEEAGGRVSRYDDSPVDLFNRQLVASNGKLHSAMLDVIRRAERPK